MERLYDVGKKDFESVYDDLVDAFIEEYRSQFITSENDGMQEDSVEAPSDKDLKKALHYSIK